MANDNIPRNDKHQKTRKKREFYENRLKNCIFSCFVMLIISKGKVVKTTATLHFVPNFVLFSMALSETSSCKGFRDLKNTPFSILQIFPSRFIDKILLYSVLDLAIQNTIWISSTYLFK